MVCPYHVEKDKIFTETNNNYTIVINDSNTEQLVTSEDKETSIITITDTIDITNKNETAKNAVCSGTFLACFAMSLCTSCNILIFKKFLQFSATLL